MSPEIYPEWKAVWNKDDLKYYDNESFRNDYTMHEMESKAYLFQQHATPIVQKVLGEILQHNRNEISILSLGCGPGSDLLGMLRTVGSVQRSRIKYFCIGVDAFEWNQSHLDNALSNMKSGMHSGVYSPIEYKFLHQDMENYLHDRSTANGLINKQFDFICLSFADAGRNLELIGKALPQLLSKFGLILVLDNDIPSVRSLSKFGFTCSYTGSNICMQSRGRALKSNSKFWPASNSPICEYRRKKDTEIQRLQAMQSAGAARQVRTAYPDITKNKSWCDGCSIL